MPKLFKVEPAKSSRSACRHCKDKIEKGVLRVAKVVWRKVPKREEPVENFEWYHLECIDKVPSTAIETPDEFIYGYSDLSDEQKTDLMAHFEAVKVEVAATEKVTETFDVPPYQPPTLGMKEHLRKRTVAKLKEELEANDNPKTGKKDDLVERIADGRTNGRIPQPCRACGGGKIKFLPTSQTYFCPGYYDDTGMQSCNVKYQWNEIKREPWTWPSDDSQEAVTKEEERLQAEQAEIEAAVELPSEEEFVEKSESEEEFVADEDEEAPKNVNQELLLKERPPPGVSVSQRDEAPDRLQLKKEKTKIVMSPSMRVNRLQATVIFVLNITFFRKIG
ncbi:hypothetical protein GEMRC1_002643 [Eukaryota sp. GEM-RC1]